MPSVLVSPSARPWGLAALSGVALALALPVLGVRAWSTAYADRLAGAISAGLSTALGPLSPVSDELQSSEPAEAEIDANEAAGLRRAAFGSKPARASGRSRGGPVQHGIRISSGQVLALAARRAMPQAVPVKANAQHPAGLLLRGVSALGVGLQDGDVLTEAAGQKASSVAVVVGVVLAARGRQVPEISGRFFRAGVPFGLTVEQPYPKQALPG